MKYSIIVLLEEWHDDFPEFIKGLYGLFSLRRAPFEILILANSTGAMLRHHLARIEDPNNLVKCFDFNTKTSQAVCLKAGLRESSGEIIAVCGSYQQITYESLTQLLDALDEGSDIISPWRQSRVDPWIKQFQSNFFNTLVRKIIKFEVHDLSCTVRIFRREVLEETEIYGNMYRYLPVLAAWRGFKTKEIKCQHHQEPVKHRFFGLSDYFTRLIDILTLYFNVRFTKKPLRFFSGVGLCFALIGLAIISYVFAQKIFFGQPIGDRPTLLLSIFFMVLGAQVASVGLLGEIIAYTHGRGKRAYTIEKII
jgi:hypothetical protein